MRINNISSTNFQGCVEIKKGLFKACEVAKSIELETSLTRGPHPRIESPNLYYKKGLLSGIIQTIAMDKTLNKSLYQIAEDKLCLKVFNSILQPKKDSFGTPTPSKILSDELRLQNNNNKSLDEEVLNKFLDKLI